MWLKSTWIIIAAIAAISNNVQSQIIQDRNGYEIIKIENTTNAINNDRNNNYSAVLYGDIIANCMKHLLPFSNVNKNCSRDVQRFMASLNNQTRWAIQSKYIVK